MKVLHVLPTRDPRYGGPIFGTEAIDRISREKGLDSFIYPRRNKSNYGRILAYYPGLKELRKLELLMKGMSIISLHGLWTIPTTIAAFFSRRFKIPYIICPHGMLDHWSLRRSRWKKVICAAISERRNLDKASGIRFLNDEELEEAKDFGLKAPTFVLPNGVDLMGFDSLPQKKILEQNYPETKDKVIALFLGRIHPKKGFDLLIPALFEVRKNFPDLHLIIAGPDEGGYKKQVTHLISKYSLDKAVTFTGFVIGDSKKTLLGGADFFVLPSYQEGDSVAIKEAMASCLPVLITPACHFPEVTFSQTGIIVNTRVEEISEALIQLSRNSDLRKQMGKNARTLIEDRYTWDHVVDHLIEIYKDILSSQFRSSCWRL